MPPKKKKGPVVVGTVSTRSTRRESIVNIVIPKGQKTGKSPVSSPVVPKKSIKKDETEKVLNAKCDNEDIGGKPKLKKSDNFAASSKTETNTLVKELADAKDSANFGNIEIHDETDTPSQEEVVVTKVEEIVETKTTSISDEKNEEEIEIPETEAPRPEILELLKDWSDEDSSKDSVRVIQEHDKKKKIRTQDDQCLIDILEGTEADNNKNTKGVKSTARMQELKEEENPIVNIESPKVEEPDIIEECVVEDNSIIIELSDENSKESKEGKMEIERTNSKEDTNTEQTQPSSSNYSEDSSNNYEIEHIVCDASKSSNDTKISGGSVINTEQGDKFTSKVIQVSDTSVEIQFILSDENEVIPEKALEAKRESPKVKTKKDPEETSLCEKILQSMHISQKGSKQPTSDQLEESISKMSIASEEQDTNKEVKSKLLKTSLLKTKKTKKSFDSDSDMASTESDSSQRRRSLRKKLDHNTNPSSPKLSEKPMQEKEVIKVIEVEKSDVKSTFEQTLGTLGPPSKKTTKTKQKAVQPKEVPVQELMDCTILEKSSVADGPESSSNESVKELKLMGTCTGRSKTPDRDSSTSMETSTIKKSPKTPKSKLKQPDEATKMDTNFKIDATIDDVIRNYAPKQIKSVHKEISPQKDQKLKESKKKKEKTLKEEKNEESSEEVRRSDRIKTIIPVKKKSHGLVKSKSESSLHDLDTSDSNSIDTEKTTPSVSPQLSKTVKKSKSKSTENLQLVKVLSSDMPKPMDIKADKTGQAEIAARLKTFVPLKENQYKTDRQICKEAREMVCDCYLAEEDIQKDEYGCGEDCLNRLLMIECGGLCQVSERCTNKKFQKNQFAPVEVFKTEKKGLGLRAAANIAYGEFILEYIGEVLAPSEFDNRAEVYSKDKNIHFYFMSLRADAIIDATMKGNISRFINHSCDPNAETQKWTVNGELRIGFFSTRTILAGEEITFDYHFQRYGKEAQKCYCEAAICRGWLGERPDESEDEEEEDEEEEEPLKPVEPAKAEVMVPDIPDQLILEGGKEGPVLEKMDVENTVVVPMEVGAEQKPAAPAEVQEIPKKTSKKKARKDILYEDFDQLNEDIEMLLTTGLKNQAHTLKLSRLMVRAKDLDHRKKLLRVLRRGEVACRRLFLDYHGLRLMHGYMIDAQSSREDTKTPSTKLDVIQTKLELLQTLAVLPIQNKTMLIESKVIPTVEKWSKNEDILEDGDQKYVNKSPESDDPAVKEKIDEIKFLAAKLLQEWVNLKESFRIPKKQRIEQMKEHEKEANRKFLESSYAQEKESSRKNDQRYRTWSRYKSERESSRRSRHEDKDRPSAEFLKISKNERRKLFALQMELKEEERRLKQREIWRQHEMNCMMIGADPRFTAPFDPGKGFQYIWNPTLGQWQALPVPQAQPTTSQGGSNFNLPSHKPPFPFGGTSTSQFPAFPVITSTPIPSQIPGVASSVNSTTHPTIPGPVHGLPVITGSLPGINQPPLASLPVFQELKEEDPSQVKFAGPIPPPVKLPPKWKCAKDKYGRPYYYHVKLRKSQWEPPAYVEPESSDSSSSESSSASFSDSSSEPESDDDDLDDARLLVETRRQMEYTSKLKSIIPDFIKQECTDSITPSPEIKMESDNEYDNSGEQSEPLSSIDIRLKEQFNLDSDDPPKKRRRMGLCQEIIISPRTEDDHKQFKEDVKRYKATKEKLKRQKEQMMLQTKKKSKSKERRASKNPSKTRMKKEMKEWNDEHAKKVKEVFRTTMATTVVGVLNAYRKPDCKVARIANTEDFKHLARKLTHFVMLKEIKHLSSIDELVCTDNVKAKAREYIRKYMSKFGDLYQKRHDEPDFKD